MKDDVAAYIRETQRGRRKGVPLALVSARFGPAGVAAVHELLRDGVVWWSTSAARAGGDRYNLLKTSP